MVTLPYNHLQHYLFLDVTTGIVDASNSDYFLESNDLEDVDPAVSACPYDIFGDELYEKDMFMQQGRVIGNLMLDDAASESEATSRPGFLNLLRRKPKALAMDDAIDDKARMEAKS